MKNWKLIAGIMLVFLLGVATGLVTAKLVTKRVVTKTLEGGPEVVNNLIMRRLSWELKLTDEQQGQVGEIVAETQRELAQIREEARPRVARALGQATRRIRVLLTDEQAEKFDKRVLEGRERLERIERNRRLDDARVILPEEEAR